jgi:hypothetical protein
MALNSSGQLSLGGSTVGESVNLELSKAATALISLNDTDLRTLFGVSSGQISMNTGYGKSTGPTKSTIGPNSTWLFATDTIGTIGTIQTASSYINGPSASYYVTTIAQPATLGKFTWATETQGTASLEVVGGLPDGVENKISTGRVSSKTMGYWAGGSSGPVSGVPYIDVLNFATETSIANYNQLIQSRSQVAGLGAAEYGRGYFCTGRGEPSNITFSEVDGIIFASNTMINPSIGAFVQSRFPGCRWSSATRGYFAGGLNLNQIDGIQYSTETNIDPSTGLVQARTPWGSHSLTKGYAFGGNNPLGPTVTYYGQVDGMVFATESGIDPATDINPGGTGAAVAAAGNNFGYGATNFAGTNSGSFY